jgi:hypothetical protein
VYDTETNVLTPIQNQALPNMAERATPLRSLAAPRSMRSLSAVSGQVRSAACTGWHPDLPGEAPTVKENISLFQKACCRYSA